MSKQLLVCGIVISLILFIYSYGFVDLNLTLSSNPIVFNFVTWAQHLVYFDRTLSIKVFITLILIMFMLYVSMLSRWFVGTLNRFPWLFISCLGLIFSLSYPMLSSDIFKYLFGAKEILVYHANPYLVTPNTFENDTWIRFMRWIHTTTPYGPTFTLYTIPFYLAGFGKFIPVLYLFKLGNLAWYLLSIWLIGKLKDIRSQLYFALNPLVLMEWLINSHNDAIMITLLVLSIYLYTLKKRVWSLLSVLLSIGVKYVTVIFLPIILFSKLFKPKLTSIIYLLISFLGLAPLLYNYTWQYQPWYVTWLVPLAALIPSKTIKWTVGVYSFSVFSRYLYFVSTGSWLGTPLQHALMTFLPPALILVYNGIHAVVSQTQKT